MLSTDEASLPRRLLTTIELCGMFSSQAYTNQILLAVSSIEAETLAPTLGKLRKSRSSTTQTSKRHMHSSASSLDVDELRVFGYSVK